MKRREIDLYGPHVKALLDTVSKLHERDYLILRVMAEQGFRVGEVVGSAARRWVYHCPQCKGPVTVTRRKRTILHIDCLKCVLKWEDRSLVPSHWEKMEKPNLPGLMIEDLRDDGVWVRGKGGTNKFQALSPETVKRLRGYTGKRNKGRIFDITEQRVEQFIKKYARDAGIEEAQLVHPHRLRNFVGSELKEQFDVKVAQDVLRHKNPVTTLTYYVRQTAPEKKREATDALKSMVYG